MWKLRKMGHITITGSSMNIVKSRVNSIQNNDQSQTAVIPQVAIIMGSDSDLPIMKDAAVVLKNFDVPFEVIIVSAHRTPDRMYSFASSAKNKGIHVIIAGTGGAAHLPGLVASLTSLPVIGIPIRTASLDGVDSLLSIVEESQWPPLQLVIQPMQPC
ncbi:N5-carboxyaminoimidazole ribonucleotide mutase [Dioscorea cayenensis subsp. rotundata]|uniref:phosphoribosylaminoimidazole carboxylase n=1 Tax=Dioscorea cayennensis subsp. rotundata TaxID=55577 RepID=A0AB40AWU4_DIOCR|nr:N5-carboxyaminoimidazole ribonucleotide mutase [Dioscorea cayenensis subsp. rotundata]